VPAISDVDEVGAVVGVVLAPVDVTGLLEPLERPPGVAAVDEEPARQRVLGGCAGFALEHGQQPGLGVVEA
jgi:hypothetical protein